MKWPRLCALAVSIGVGLASPLSTLRANAPPESFQQSQPMPFTVEGKIHRLEQKKITLSTEENMLFHVLYDDKTEIRQQDGTAGSAKDLRVGLIIRVEGDLSESGEVLAHRIEIQGPEEKKP